MADSPEPARALTLLQALFIRHFLGQARGNASEAARLAGDKSEKDNDDVIGAQLLKHPIIAMRVSEYVTDFAVSADEVLSELATIAMAPWSDFVVEITNAKGVRSLCAWI